MPQVSLFRLYLLRAFYALMAVGLTLTMWPTVVSHSLDWPRMHSVVGVMLSALGLLCYLGIRHPLKMLPLLLFELVWKAIWLVAVALPLWRAGGLSPEMMRSFWEILPGLLLLLVIPWDYVWAAYIRAPGERWRNQPTEGAAVLGS
ncbi:MAG: hypothetical protein ACT4OE_00365 [Sphingosinicella sp.]